MITLAWRDVRNSQGELDDALSRNDLVLVNKGGQPYVIMVNVVGQELQEVSTVMTRLRAQMAVTSMRLAAVRAGLDGMTEEEIETRINSSRATTDKE